MLRAVLITAAIAVGSLVGVAIALQSERVEHRLKHYLAQALERELDLDVSIDDLELRLLPLAVTLRQVRIGSAEDDTLFQVHEAYASIQPWPSGLGVFVIEELKLIGPQFRGRRDDNGGAPPSSPLRIDIKKANIIDAQVDVSSAESTIRVESLNASWAPIGRDVRRFEANILTGHAQHAGRTLPFNFEARGQFNGPLNNVALVSLERFFLDLPVGNVAATGSLGDTLDEANAIQATVHADAETIGNLLELPTNIAGAVALTTDITGTFSNPEFGFTVSSDAFRLETAEIGAVAADFRINGDTIRVSTFSLSRPDGSKITGSGFVDTATTQTELSAKTTGLNVGSVLSARTPALSPLQGAASIRAELKGAFVPLSLRTNLRGSIKDFSWTPGRRPSPRGPLLAVNDLELDAELEINQKEVAMKDVLLTWAGSEVRAEGSIPMERGGSLNISATGSPFDFAQVGPIKAIPLAGTGQVTATIAGPLDAVATEIFVHAKDFAFGNRPLGEVHVVFGVLKKRLTFHEILAHVGGGFVSASGEINFAEEQNTIQGDVRVDSVRWPHLAPIIPVGNLWQDNLTAEVNGTMTVSGLLDHPTLDARFETPELRARGARLGPATGAFAMRQDRDWNLTLETTTQTSQTETQVASESRVLKLTSSGEGLPGSVLSPWVTKPIEGRLAYSVATTIDNHLANGVVDVSCSACTISGFQLGGVTGKLALENNHGSLQASVHNGALPIAGTIELSPTVPYDVAATLSDFELGRFVTNASWSAIGSGVARSKGRLLVRRDQDTSLSLRSLSVRADDLKATAQETIHARLKGTEYRIQGFSLAGSGAEFRAAGHGRLDGNIDVQIVGTARAQTIVPQVVSSVTSARGRIGLDVSIEGQHADPQILGSLSVKNGALKFQEFRQPLENIVGRFAFEGRRLVVKEAVGRWGGGHAALSGRMTLTETNEPEIDVRADLAGVTLSPNASTDLTLTGGVQLQGLPGSLVMTGDIEIPRAEHRTSLGLDRLLPRRRQSPIPVPTIDPDRMIALDVRVSANDGLVLTSDVVEAEFGADITLVGTTQNVGVLGSLTPRSGRARYRERVFDLERGSVLFVDEYAINPRYELFARTTGCGMDITVDVQGSEGTPNIVLTGRDERGIVDPQEVFSCLQFGVRLNETDPAGENLFAGDRLLPSSIDAVWTVSGMNQTLQKLIPLDLDEFRLASCWSSGSNRNAYCVSVSKGLGRSKRFRIAYSGALDQQTSDHAFTLEYQMSDFATLEGAFLSSNASPLDFGPGVRFHWDFR